MSSLQSVTKMTDFINTNTMESFALPFLGEARTSMCGVGVNNYLIFIGGLKSVLFFSLVFHFLSLLSQCTGAGEQLYRRV